MPGPTGLIDLHRNQRQRTIKYGVDRENIFRLQEELEEEMKDVEIIQLPQRIMPPEIEKRIQ